MFLSEQILNVHSFHDDDVPSVDLEAQLAEEPLASTVLVAFLELHANMETRLLALDGIFQVLGAELRCEIDVLNGVTCWEQVVVVHELKRGND